MAEVSVHLDQQPGNADDAGGADNKVPPKGIGKYKLAVVLAVVAVCLYGLSIVSIVFTRGAGA